MSRHGRATIPFGRYKGVEVRELPDGELSSFRQYVVNINGSGGAGAKWTWLLTSIEAEMTHRGFHVEPIEREVLPIFNLRCVNCNQIFQSTGPRAHCANPNCLHAARNIVAVSCLICGQSLGSVQSEHASAVVATCAACANAQHRWAPMPAESGVDWAGSTTVIVPAAPAPAARAPHPPMPANPRRAISVE